jgi:potassium-transporting ATPase KdpC subunit
MMRRQLLPALGMLLVFTVITGLAYPLVVTGVAQGLFADKANGSRVEVDGQLVGSASIGQPFSAPEYFHPRPSAAGYAPGPGYSFGSNFGPTNETFLFGEDDPETADVDESETNGVDDLVRAYRETNGLDAEALVPVDAVTSSASGLDPHISVANARIQAQRVADSRGLDVDQVLELVQDNTDGRDLGFLGEPGVNVLLLNLALDQLG